MVFRYLLPHKYQEWLKCPQKQDSQKTNTTICHQEHYDRSRRIVWRTPALPSEPEQLPGTKTCRNWQMTPDGSCTAPFQLCPRPSASIRQRRRFSWAERRRRKRRPRVLWTHRSTGCTLRPRCWQRRRTWVVSSSFLCRQNDLSCVPWRRLKRKVVCSFCYCWWWFGCCCCCCVRACVRACVRVCV